MMKLSIIHTVAFFYFFQNFDSKTLITDFFSSFWDFSSILFFPMIFLP